MTRIDQVIEQLRCAAINCDNTKKIGIQFVDFVKAQIEDGIKMLEEMEEKSSHQANEADH